MGFARLAVAAMLHYVRRWPDRVWTIEGCDGIGPYANLGPGEGVEVHVLYSNAALFPGAMYTLRTAGVGLTAGRVGELWPFHSPV